MGLIFLKDKDYINHLLLTIILFIGFLISLNFFLNARLINFNTIIMIYILITIINFFALSIFEIFFTIKKYKEEKKITKEKREIPNYRKKYEFLKFLFSEMLSFNIVLYLLINGWNNQSIFLIALIFSICSVFYSISVSIFIVSKLRKSGFVENISRNQGLNFFVIGSFLLIFSLLWIVIFYPQNLFSVFNNIFIPILLIISIIWVIIGFYYYKRGSRE